MSTAPLLSSFRRPRRPLGRAAGTLLVWAVVGALLLSSFATVTSAVAAISAFGGAAQDMPCGSMMEPGESDAGAHARHASSPESSGEEAPTSPSCPLMADGMCLALIAVPAPSAAALDAPLPPSDLHDRLASADLVPQVVPPPQRPPNSL